MVQSRWALVVIFVMGIPASAQALYPFESWGLGITGPAFLNLPYHPRALAMGEAYVAAADDLGALDFNPAGLTRLYAGMLRLQHREWNQQIRAEELAFGFPAGPMGFGGSFAYGYYEKGGVANVVDSTGAKVGSFTPYNLLGRLAAAFSIKKNLAFGVQWKYTEEVFNLRSSDPALGDRKLRTKGYMFDWGLQGGAPSIGLMFGFSWSNLGPGYAGANLPEIIRLGGSYRPKATVFKDNPMTLSAQFEWPLARPPSARLGFEWTLARALSFRAGYVYPRFQRILKDGKAFVWERFRFGFGIGDEYFKLDYAYMPDDLLGASHLASITFAFGSSKPKPTPTPIPTPIPTPAMIEEKPEATLAEIPPGTRPVITTTLAGNRRITLEWEPAFDGKISGFLANVTFPGGKTKRFPASPLQKNRMVLGGLVNERAYVISILIAYDAVHEGPPSEPVTLVPMNILDESEEVLFADLRPTDLTGTIRGERMIITWKKPRDKRVAGTYLEMRQGKQGSYRRISPLIPSKTSLVALKVKGGSDFPAGKYYFRLIHSDGIVGEGESLSRPSVAVILTKRQKIRVPEAQPSETPEALEDSETLDESETINESSAADEEGADDSDFEEDSFEGSGDPLAGEEEIGGQL